MRAFWKLIVVAIVALGGLAVVDVAPASAVMLKNCSGGTQNGNTVGWVRCSSFDVTLAGVGQVRAEIRCQIGSTVSGTYVGPWVGLNQTSSVACPAGWTVWGLWYTRR